MKRLLPWVVALLFAAAAIYFAARSGLRTAETRSVSAAPVVAALRRIAQLATVEIQISDVVRYEEAKHFLVFDFPKSATLRLAGRVLGGFDLTGPEFRIEPEASSRVVRIALPRPRILAVDPRFEWFDERSGFFNPITPQDRTRWLLWARGQLGRAARDAGIDVKAEEHARQLLTASADAFGWRAQVSVAGGGAPPAIAATP
jgi:hypothetical protein